jgi:hypothetical protein
MRTIVEHFAVPDPDIPGTYAVCDATGYPARGWPRAAADALAAELNRCATEDLLALQVQRASQYLAADGHLLVETVNHLPWVDDPAMSAERVELTDRELRALGVIL